ncbi:hypothetical protein JZ751_009728 [Albula glossodonta]|uniref:Uncharacterized protein n=1 Tax=Albula glossodonta TaxID=121402 RepID=A0A8T2NXX8_9TELE|nr:hypothetical protein JZ751_009728 [Albula glossodonta]
MAEFGENGGVSSTVTEKKLAGIVDETEDEAQCKESVSNGDCGVPAMVGPESPTKSDSPGLETANSTSVGLDPKAGIPRRSSIIKPLYKLL